MASHLAIGRPPQDVADEFGFSRDYIYHLNREELFAAEVERLSNIGVEHSTKKVMTVRALAADKSADAMRKLAEHMNNGNASISIKAAHEILTFGGVKPPERTEIDLTSRQANKLVIADDSHVTEIPDEELTDDDRLLASYDALGENIFGDSDFDEVLERDDI